jgi:hypothetical protein
VDHLSESFALLQNAKLSRILQFFTKPKRLPTLHIPKQHHVWKTRSIKNGFVKEELLSKNNHFVPMAGFLFS